MTSPRVKCQIGHCRRTRPAHPTETEWLCGRHWGAVPKPMRRAYLRSKRIGKSLPIRVRLWCRVVRAAIEAAMADPRL